MLLNLPWLATTGLDSPCLVILGKLYHPLPHKPPRKEQVLSF